MISIQEMFTQLTILDIYHTFGLGEGPGFLSEEVSLCLDLGLSSRPCSCRGEPRVGQLKGWPRH